MFKDQSKNSCCAVNRSSIDDRIKGPLVGLEKASLKDKHLEDMVLINGGEFLMGTDDKEGFPSDGEGPVRNVEVHSFLIDRYTVTNEKFKEFVDETNYITEAERYGWSFVFYQLLSESIVKEATQSPVGTPWWRVVQGAYWLQPEGPDSHIHDRMNHPVLHISWNDALAYCKWAGKRLPTEAEWEYAARGGFQQKKFPWGDELHPNGDYYCNIWQGDFPYENTISDGFLGTAPVNAFPPNNVGLYNMSGNVWEWCQDWFSPTFHINSSKVNPIGPSTGAAKVMRGGSYLCHDSYCNRYRVAARTGTTPDSSTGNIGFRCVKDLAI